VVAVACRPFGFTFLVWHFFATATMCHFLSRAGLPYVFAACFRCVKIYIACYMAPCTIHWGWGFVGVWRGPVCLAFGSSPLGGYKRTSGRASWSLLKCTVQCGVESTEDQLWVSWCCRSWCFELSVFWRFASSFRLSLLWSLNSCRRWPSPWYYLSLQATLFSRASKKP